MNRLVFKERERPSRIHCRPCVAVVHRLWMLWKQVAFHMNRPHRVDALQTECVLSDYRTNGARSGSETQNPRGTLFLQGWRLEAGVRIELTIGVLQAGKGGSSLFTPLADLALNTLIDSHLRDFCNSVNNVKHPSILSKVSITASITQVLFSSPALYIYEWDFYEKVL